tara:strand:+ start:60666 stop:62012 length:1347 start_codon:yes stop_codon:yes gene_type:complete
MLGMVVLLSGLGLRSAQAQYAAGATVPSGNFYSQTAYQPGYSDQQNYETPPDYYQTPDQYAYGYNRNPYGETGDQSDMISRALPVDRGWAYDHPMDGLFQHLVQNSWMRVEYLLWKAPPGNQLIGSAIPSGNDPRLPFIGVDANGFGTVSTRELDLSTVGKQGANGIRGTYGIDFISGSIEASFFGMDSEYSSVSVGKSDLLGPDFGTTDLISILTSVDGLNPGTDGRQFNEKVEVTYQHSAWGVESNYVINTERLLFRTYYGAGGLQIRPMLGFRYLRIGEQMLIKGGFEEPDTTPAQPFFESTINSETSNKLYVPQAGIRMEFVHPWFTVSAQPKVGFGVNNYNGSVLTNQFWSEADPTHITRIAQTRFAPTFELGLNARIHLSENFTFNVGYNFLWANQVARPGNIIYYNTSSSDPNTGVSLQAKNSLDSYTLHGLVIGGEIRFP